MNDMRTDSKGLLEAGLELLHRAVAGRAGSEFGWQHGADRYVIHQVSQVHTDGDLRRRSTSTRRWCR